MLRVVLVAIALVLVAALGVIAARWASEHFVAAPAPVIIPADAPIRHRGAEIIAKRAIEQFHALPDGEREAIVGNLRDSMLPVRPWLAGIDRLGYEFICLGERHADATRRFLAEQVLRDLPMDVLLLETTPDELAESMARMQANEPYVSLLDADIGSVIRAARERNPELAIAGIEEQAAQRARRQTEGHGTRDKSITENFRTHVRRGKRHVVLIGALHCTDQEDWLYRRVRESERRIGHEHMINVNVLGSHQDGALEAFLAFLDEVGIAHGDFVIADTSALHPAIYDWFATLTRRFGYYRTVVVFDEAVEPLALPAIDWPPLPKAPDSR